MNYFSLGFGIAQARSLRQLMRRGYCGIAAALIRARDKYYEVPGRIFDAWHGVDTCGIVAVPDLDINEAAKMQAVRYQPTKLAVFSQLLRRLPIEDRGQFAFVDYGCGKGLCLLLAARAGFGRVVGVELSEALCQAAARNASTFKRGRFASNIRVKCTHSAAAPFPKQPTVHYFYNPFGEEAMSQTMHSIAAHLNETGDEAYAIYVNQMHGGVIAEGGFRLVKSGRRRSEDWAIWHRPAATAGSKLSTRAA